MLPNWFGMQGCESILLSMPLNENGSSLFSPFPGILGPAGYPRSRALGCVSCAQVLGNGEHRFRKIRVYRKRCQEFDECPHGRSD